MGLNTAVRSLLTQFYSYMDSGDKDRLKKTSLPWSCSWKDKLKKKKHCRLFYIISFKCTKDKTKVVPHSEGWLY